MLKTLTIDELEVGMMVKNIMLKDSDTKVKNQGRVNSLHTIEQLKKQGVAKVIIECDQGDIAETETANTEEDSSKNNILADTDDSKNNKKSTVGVSLKKEFSRSCDIYDEATEKVKDIFLQAESGKNLTPEALTILAGEITESVQRNEYAITILTRIRHRSKYHWEHSINCAVLICGFGLYLGFNKDTVTQMTLGALLHDIGIAKVSKVILEKPGKLSNNEMSVVRKHVTWGYNMCKRDGLNNPIIIDMTVNHHERLDGSGYPRGITKDKITKLARITAIIDIYDAMTGDRPYKKSDLPIEALRYLMSKKEQFDQELVQSFIKYLGVHPVGTLVKLSNNRLAIVSEGNRVNPLKPIVKIVFNVKSNRLITPTDCDLNEEDIKIEASVQPEEYDINVSRLIRSIFT